MQWIWSDKYHRLIPVTEAKAAEVKASATPLVKSSKGFKQFLDYDTQWDNEQRRLKNGSAHYSDRRSFALARSARRHHPGKREVIYL